MKKLYEAASLIRSKNAGPFMVTIDIIFPNHSTFERISHQDALSVKNVAALYHIPEEKLQRYELPLANAVKFSFPRKYPAGDFMDTDLYGCQHHRPLVLLDVEGE